MSRRLGGSLRHIHEQATGPARLEPAGLARDLVEALEAGAAVSADAFAIHSDMLRAVAAQDLPQLRRLFSELLDGAYMRSGLQIRPIRRPYFSPRGHERYLRYAGSDPDIPLALVAPDDNEFRAFRASVEAARDLLGQAVPELRAEFDALVGEIVVGTIDQADDGGGFDGVSVFDLWGALVINPRRHVTLLDTVSVLVHEATHLLLFAWSIDEPLVLNPSAERFVSPVRADARPMDGVFHGTYVIAMLDYLFRRLVASGQLPAADRDVANDLINQYQVPFAAGMKVIRDQGRLTETGRRAIDDAEAYMARARG